jgi:hypothetical protein
LAVVVAGVGGPGGVVDVSFTAGVLVSGIEKKRRRLLRGEERKR